MTSGDVHGVAVLGSTGSIGENTLDVIAQHPDRYRVVALAAYRSVDKLRAQCLKFNPDYAVLVDEQAAAQLREQLHTAGCATQVWSGMAALDQIVVLPEVHSVMAAIVGAAGLGSTLAAAKAGKRLLLANKESLVMAGPLLIQAVQQSGAELIPIDSEHNAIFQCLPMAFHDATTRTGTKSGIRRLLLTASGGPFLRATVAQLASVTPQAACAHPRWVMGRKISVDSATLMNKGLELIEAHVLFDMPVKQIDVVVHPQSIIHSLVEYVDGSVLAQLGNPDMRTPIACGLAWPERVICGVESLDLIRIGKLDFEAPDRERFPALRLAEQAADASGTAPAVLNAANEVAVAAFLDECLPFTGIPALIESVLAEHAAQSVQSVEQVLEVDAWARGRAQAWLKSNSNSASARVFG